MFANFKQKPAYYSVHALRDRTIWLAMQTTKPSKSQKPSIDEDGIYRWFLDEEPPDAMSGWGRGLFDTTVAMTLNMKRIVRQQVESKLDQILERLESIENRLQGLEKSAATT